MNNAENAANQAVLFTSKQCPHCPAVLKILNDLNRSGKLTKLDVYDIAQAQALAEQYQVRSVPWFRIAELEFQGLHTAGELAYWVEHAHTNEGILRYLIDNLNEGKLSTVEALINSHPSWLNIALQILSDLDTPIQARIGLGAVLEGLAGTSMLEDILPLLEKLTQHDDHRVRGDACHYLGFINTLQSRKILKHCLADEHAEVREIAQDSLINV